MVDISKMKPPDKEAFQLMKQQMESAEELEHLLNDNQDDTSQINQDEQPTTNAAMIIKESLNERSLSPQKQKINKIKKIIKSDVYQQYKDIWDNEDDNDDIGYQI